MLHSNATAAGTGEPQCHVPGYTLPRHQIDSLPWGITGCQWQIVRTRLKVDAQLDPQKRSCAQYDDHPAQPHGIVTTLRPWACMLVGTLPTSLDPDGQFYRDMFRPCLTNEHGIGKNELKERQASGRDFRKGVNW